MTAQLQQNSSDNLPLIIRTISRAKMLWLIRPTAKYFNLERITLQKKRSIEQGN